ncbi:MAG TPA: ABC transporter ATP-binding protein [Gemmatimonas sp.]|uniref:ABC transporter ATP-binding protein n=1 Tax=Gemmatimonas sp. TaxID=1962908 RepID=UPI002ED8EF40
MTAPASHALLDVRALRIAFPASPSPVHVVNGVDLSVEAGETVCIVGESGCGKSMTALSLLRLVPSPGQITAGSTIRFDDQDLLSLDERALRSVRGRQMAMIFQEPMTALNPVLTVGDQIAEVVRVHTRCSAKEAWARTVEMLAQVGIADAAARAKQYPHELSGGMRQRVMIAMALILSPKLVIADEPTTALDVTIQAQILDLLRTMRERSSMALLLITHDLGVVAEMASRVLVMYAGRVVEEAAVETLFASPAHPYTEGLMAAMPRLGQEQTRLTTIRGSVPPPNALPSGCTFRDRCPHAFDRCAQEEPALLAVSPQHHVRCHLVEEPQRRRPPVAESAA